MTSPHLFPLASLQCLKVAGAQSKPFLQGQLTCDTRLVSPNHMRPGALCDLKGRVVAVMDVVEWNDVFLIYSGALHKLIQKSLAMAAKLSRVTLEVSPSIKCMGLFFPASSSVSLPFTLPTERFQLQTTPEVACYSVLPDCYILMYEQEPTWFKDLPALPEASWHQMLLSQQAVFIYPETSGQFLAQRLNLDKTEHISFNKGCYKGQEIIARMHFRGVNKYELVTSVISTTRPLLPGMPILSPTSQQQIGEIVDVVAMRADEYLILASMLKSETLKSG
ncbi:MAG: hypothetical protein NTW08_02995 [Gammaproteobacteria bacterium]|nr:hypothetical protein [Gammaproteobacteria bacterium]